ncbi:uncharacterized protein LOC117111263 [Anneissia japonica]|uniref:uncharacterized protein LOC117111263 n=1 Tax=Anneissia japonica TaxID=1529436 RepID=UPI0014254FC0|nr:uncharacterized protein LOC117111263 [Anneissia japonica]
MERTKPKDLVFVMSRNPKKGKTVQSSSLEGNIKSSKASLSSPMGIRKYTLRSDQCVPENLCEEDNGQPSVTSEHTGADVSVSVGMDNNEDTLLHSRQYRTLKEKIVNFSCENVIFGGDFNCVINPILDKYGGRQAEISKDSFNKLLSVFSKFYNNNSKYINMLKVLYSDHIISRSELSEADSALDLLNLLKIYGSLSRKNITILYDTIKVTKHFGLKEEIQEQVPKCRCPDLKEIVITEFTAHRQKLIKLGHELSPVDRKSICGLYNISGEYKDNWSLIMVLENKLHICDKDEKMKTFTTDMKTLEIPRAVNCLTEDIPNAPSSPAGRHDETICMRMDRKRKSQNDESEDEPFQDPLVSVENIVDNKGKLTAECTFECVVTFAPIPKHFKKMSVTVKGIGSGSLIFYLSVSDHNALENLYNISLRKELLQDLAKLLLPAELQAEFVDRWSTDIEKEEYEVALSKLKAKGQCDLYHFCIISDDPEWETTLMEELKQKRPDLNYTFMKKWRLGKPETINRTIGKSKNVIVGFSPKSLTDYSKYAAHSVVLEMLEAKTLDNDKIIPFKITEDGVVPPGFESFLCDVWEEFFVDKLLQKIDKCEPQVEVSEGNTDASIDNLTEMDVKDSKEVQNDMYDFCFISDNSEWENNLMEKLQERIPDIKCTSKQDLSKLNKDNLITKIEKSKKVILGFSTQSVTLHSNSAANVVKEMLEENTLHHAKLIPVKISFDAFVPPDFKLFTVANGWEKQFVEKLEETYDKSMKTYSDSSYNPEDQDMKRSGSETSLSSNTSGYSTGTDMTSESTKPEDKSSSGCSSESGTTAESTDPKLKFDETENFKIIKSLVIKLGTKKMTEFFFKAFLKNEREKGSFKQMKDLKLRHKIYSPDAEFITFDISIIMTLIRYCCGFTYLDEDWEQPDRIQLYNPVISNLIRIMQYKNTLDENIKQRLSTNKFEEEWNGIKEVLFNLGVPLTDIDAGLNTVYFEEIQNFQAVMSLVLELGTEALRNYVLQVNNIQEKDVGQFLMDEKDNLMKAKLLPEQKKKMFSKKADIRSFDIPIMMKIIRHCNQLPDSFWSEPDEDYIDKLANLVHIHRYANTKLAHRANARMSKKEFDMDWKNLTLILQNVGVSIEKIEKYKPLHLLYKNNLTP